MVKIRVSAEQFRAQPGSHFLRLNGVLERIPVSKTSWYEGISNGLYPPGVDISPGGSGKVTAWLSDDIDKLVEKLIARGQKEKRGVA